MVTGFGTEARRHACWELVLSGAPLRRAAQALGMPMWMRRLPPEAYGAPLSGPLPDGERFARRIANSLLSDLELAHLWLRHVLLAHRLVGEEFALWLAREMCQLFNWRSRELFTLLVTWAWFSSRPGNLGQGSELLAERWHPALGTERAFELASAWCARIDLAIALDAKPRALWSFGGTACAYEFLPLRTVADFLAEARAMGNCLDSYGQHLSRANVRVFSVRKAGVRVAVLELAPHSESAIIPTISQLKGPRNTRVATAVWRAAYTWLGQQHFRPLEFSHTQRSRLAFNSWRRIWAPFLAELRGTDYESEIRSAALALNRRSLKLCAST